MLLCYYSAVMDIGRTFMRVCVRVYSCSSRWPSRGLKRKLGIWRVRWLRHDVEVSMTVIFLRYTFCPRYYQYGGGYVTKIESFNNISAYGIMKIWGCDPVYHRRQSIYLIERQHRFGSWCARGSVHSRCNSSEWPIKNACTHAFALYFYYVVRRIICSYLRVHGDAPLLRAI